MTESKAVQHLGNININDEWETPQRLLLEYINGKDLPYPQLDVACTHKNCKCRYGLYYDLGVDGLDTHWYFIHDGSELEEDVIFCNPPYSQVAKWVKKAYYEWLTRRVNIILLTYAKTDTKWFHDIIEPNRKNDEFDVDFIRGRLHFELDGKPYYYWSEKKQRWIKGVSPYPSMWVWMKGPL